MTNTPQRPHITEGELEQLIDRAVHRRLRTDRAYRNAQDADTQAQREQQISDEELARYWSRFEVV